MTVNAAGTHGDAIAGRMVRWFGWCCLAFVLTMWLSITLLGDRAWWTVVLLFGPRWVFAAPLLGAVPWLLADWRSARFPTLAGVLIAVFGLLDFHLGLHRASVGSGVPFRVLELNADGGVGAQLQARILAEFRERKPDLIVIAECSQGLGDALKQLAEYTGPPSQNGMCLLSRGAIASWAQRDQREIWIQGGAGYIIRAVVTTAAGPIRVGLVHLETPRQALDSYFSLHLLPQQGPQTWVNINQRDEESRYAREWILQGESLPTVIAGDFNLTTESAIYKRYWGDFRNAFGRAGWGTGYTKFTRRWGVRIDHVLTSDDIGTHSAFVGPNVGSDHRPLIVDLVLPNQRTSTAR